MTTNQIILHNVTPDDLKEIIRETLREQSVPNDNKSDDTLYTPAEVDKILRISQPTRDKLDRQGKIHSVRIGMKKFYRKQEIERFLNDQENKK